jgi:hypothetical protein
LLQKRSLDDLPERLQELEEKNRYVANGASSTAFSLDEKYTVVQLAQLYLLIDICRNNCTHCTKGQFFVTNLSMVGHECK